jgi:anti-sigma28 factor (negative regulator of flagellin synthesis)
MNTPSESLPDAAGAQREDTGSVTVEQSSQGVSEERIAELRRQYLDGTYHVDIDKVSAKIVDEHLIK